jgi:hypothetical protein
MLQPSFEVEQPLQLYNKILLINFDEDLIMPLFIGYIKELIPDKINILRIQELRKKKKFYNLNYCAENRKLNYTYNELVKSKEEALRINIAKNFFHTNKVGYNTKFLGWLNFSLPVKSMMKVFRKISCTKITKPLIIYYGMCLAVQFQVLKMLNKNDKEIENNLRQTIDYGINCGILNKLIDQLDYLMLKITNRVKHIKKNQSQILQIEPINIQFTNTAIAPHIQYANQKEFFNLLIKNYYNYPHNDKLAFLKKIFFEINSGRKISSKEYKEFKNTLYLLGATTNLLNSIAHINRYNNGKIKDKEIEVEQKNIVNDNDCLNEKIETDMKNQKQKTILQNCKDYYTIKDNNKLSCRYCERFKTNMGDFEGKIIKLENEIRKLTDETNELHDSELIYKIYKYQDLYIKIIDHFIKLYTLAHEMKIRDSKLNLSNKWLDEIRGIYIDKEKSATMKFVESRYDMFYLKINVKKIIERQKFVIEDKIIDEEKFESNYDNMVNKLGHKIFHDIKLFSALDTKKDKINKLLNINGRNLSLSLNIGEDNECINYINKNFSNELLENINNIDILDNTKVEKCSLPVKIQRIEPMKLLHIRKNIQAKKKVYINMKNEKKREIRKMLLND